MSNEEELLGAYVERFNAHDIEAVMNCFDDDALGPEVATFAANKIKELPDDRQRAEDTAGSSSFHEPSSDGEIAPLFLQVKSGTDARPHAFGSVAKESGKSSQLIAATI